MTTLEIGKIEVPEEEQEREVDNKVIHLMWWENGYPQGFPEAHFMCGADKRSNNWHENCPGKHSKWEFPAVPEPSFCMECGTRFCEVCLLEESAKLTDYHEHNNGNT